MAKGNKDVKRGIVLYIDGKEVQNNAHAIQAEMRKLKKEIDGCTVGSDEYIQKTRQYRQLNTILQEHKANLKGIETQTKANAAASQNWLQKGIAMFNRYSVAILGFMAAFTGVAMKIADFRKKNMEKESSQANLKALTGLDDSSIEWLTKQAEKLSTTMDESGLRVKKSAQEILKAYTMVGSKKPELLQDKEALNAVTIEAMRLAEAANIELTEAVAGVTLAMNQYGAAADEASRYVNVLAAGSKMGAVGVATQTESIVKAGVAASRAEVPIEQLVGVLETLGERGIEGSVAGTQLKTFFLRLEAGAEDTRPSVVGLQQALENLAKKNLDVTEMTKMFGLESITTAQALISSAEKVKYYTDAVTGTNVAVEQAAINSDTMEAKMAQLKNQINETGMALAKDLAPVFSKFTHWSTKSVMALPPLVKFLKEYGGQVMIVATAITVLSFRISILNGLLKAKLLWLSLSEAAQKGWALSLTASKIAINGGSIALGRYKVALLSSNVATRAATAVSALLRSAMLLVTGQFTAAAASARAFVVAVSAINPWVLGVAVLGVAAVKLYEYRKELEKTAERVTALQEVERKTTEEFEKQRSKVETLYSVLKDNNVALGERKKALNELREITPGYLGDLTEEGRLINDNKDAIDKYLLSLEHEIRLKAAKEELEDSYRKKREKQKELDEAKEQAAEAKKKSKEEGRSRRGGALGVSGSSIVADVNLAKADSKVNDLKEELENLEKDIENLNKEIAEESKKIPSSIVVEDEDEDEDGGGGGGGSSSTKKTDDRIKKEIAAVELEVKKKQNILRQSYVEGKIDRRKFNDEMQQLEMERLQNMLKIAGLEPEKVAEIQGKILEMRMKAKEELDKMSFDMSADEDLKRYHEQTQKIEDELLERISVIDSSLQLGVIAQEDYEAKMTEMWEKYDADMQSAHEAYTKKVRERKDETKEELKGLAKTFEDAGLDIKELAEDISDSLCKGVDMAFDKERAILKKILKSLLSIIIDAIEKMVIAAQVENSLLTITGIGTGAGLANLAKLVGIKIAFAALKEAVNSFDVGGYTGIGRWDEPAGIVHKGEFVANRHALANPAVKAVLDMVDNAQRRGTVANLTSDDIRAVASGPGSDINNGQTVLAKAADDKVSRELLSLLRQNIETVVAAKEAYEKPSPSYCWLEGDGGINEKQKLLSKIKKNAKRNG